MSDEQPKAWPCQVENNLIEPCWALNEATAAVSGASKRKGIIRYNMVNRDTFEPTRTLYALRSGDHEKKGLTINHCPFCGESLVTWTHRAEEENKDAQ